MIENKNITIIPIIFIFTCIFIISFTVSVSGLNGNQKGEAASSLPDKTVVKDKNLCATRYVKVNDKDAKISSVNIAAKECTFLKSSNNPIDKAIINLQSCINKELQSGNFVNSKQLYDKLCLNNKLQVYYKQITPQTSLAEAVKLIQKGIASKEVGNITVPSSCKAELDNFLKVRKIYLNKIDKNATTDDYNSCTFKGVATCYENLDGSFTCVTKKEDQKTPHITSDNGQTVPPAKTYAPSYPKYQTYTKSNDCNNIGSNNGDGFFGGLMQKMNYVYNFKQWSEKCITTPGNVNSGIPIKGGVECKISASDTSPKYGDKIRVSWISSGGNSVQFKSGGSVISTKPKGYKDILVTKDEKYTLLVLSKSGQEKKCSLNININTDETASLTCAPSRVQKGENVTLKWECPLGSYLSESNFGISLPAGRVVKQIKETSSFNIKCKTNDNKVFANSCNVNVVTPKYEIIAYPKRVSKGESVKISWASLFDTCRVTGPNGFDYSLNKASVMTVPFEIGAKTESKATYTMSCNNGSKSITVELNP